MSSKISDERLAELIEFHKENLRGTMPKEVSDYYSDEVSALTELAEYRAREAASTSQYGYREPEYGTVWVPCETAEEAATYGQPGDALVRRRVGPWESVSDDE
ncbi:hypothetical protein [Gulosibacter massiliensis]|uniref:hypothetical protein n=1 Tax=Gulosibacter massiliensis TaxID=2479839 RepID=UPI000F6337C1|nr:hypothetical protein [Gulosibacter massiliensis]